MMTQEYLTEDSDVVAFAGKSRQPVTLLAPRGSVTDWRRAVLIISSTARCAELTMAARDRGMLFLHQCLTYDYSGSASTPCSFTISHIHILALNLPARSSEGSNSSTNSGTASLRHRGTSCAHRRSSKALTTSMIWQLYYLL